MNTNHQQTIQQDVRDIKNSRSFTCFGTFVTTNDAFETSEPDYGEQDMPVLILNKSVYPKSE